MIMIVGFVVGASGCRFGSQSSSTIAAERDSTPQDHSHSTDLAREYTPIGRKELPIPGIKLIRAMGEVDSLGRIALGGQHGELIQYDLMSERVLWQINMGAQVSAISRVRSSLYIGTRDGTITLIDAHDGQVQHARSVGKMPTVKKPAASAAKKTKASAIVSMHIDEELVLCVLESGQILQLDTGLKTQKVVASIDARIRTAAYDPKLKRLAVGGEADEVTVFSLKDGSKQGIPISSGWVTALAYSPAGELAVATMDRKIRVYDRSGKMRSAGSEPHAFSGHVRIVSEMTFEDVKGRVKLLSSSLDRRTIIWDVKSRQLDTPLVGHGRQVIGLSTLSSPSGPGRSGSRQSGAKPDASGVTVVTASGDGTVRTWPLPPATAWNDRVLAPPGPGEVTIRSYTRGDRLRIRLMAAADKLNPKGYAAFNEMLSSAIDGRQKEINPDAVKLFYSIVSHFGRDKEVILVSGYRSPQYNKQRTMQSKEVSKGSQHMAGNAIDFRIDGVPEIKLYEYAKSLKAGGVGLYLNSRFVHIDVGRVRTWGGT